MATYDQLVNSVTTAFSGSDTTTTATISPEQYAHIVQSGTSHFSTGNIDFSRDGMTLRRSTPQGAVKPKPFRGGDLKNIVKTAEKIVAAPFDKQEKAKESIGLMAELGMGTALLTVAPRVKMARIAELGYTKISEKNIMKFVVAKARAYDKRHGIKKELTDYVVNRTGGGYVVNTIHRNDNEGIGMFQWKEEALENYKGVPPTDVLEKTLEHKNRNVFDAFTIASMEFVKDPVVFGRIAGSTDRFWIVAWDNDISLDDLI